MKSSKNVLVGFALAFKYNILSSTVMKYELMIPSLIDGHFGFRIAYVYILVCMTFGLVVNGGVSSRKDF